MPPDVSTDQLINEQEPWYSNYCPPGVPRKPENFSPTGWSRCNFGSMLKVVDAGMGNITGELRARALWDTTLMVVQADNGGIGVPVSSLRLPPQLSLSQLFSRYCRFFVYTPMHSLYEQVLATITHSAAQRWCVYSPPCRRHHSCRHCCCS